MRRFVGAIMEALKSLRGGFVGSRAQKDTLLRPFVILAIVVLAGPDLFAATELTALLELLGATLFLLAYMSGFKLLGMSILTGLQRVFMPREYLMLVEMRGHPVAVAWGVLFLAAYSLILLSTTFFLTYFGVAILIELGRA